MPGTKSIVLDHHTVLRICNALNAEAAVFDVHASNPAYGASQRSMFTVGARDNRLLSKNLLEQWDKA